MIIIIIIIHWRNNITCSVNCKYRTAATLYTVQTWLVAGVTFSLTPCSTVLLEKLTGLQLFKKFPAFYGNRRFITALISTHHMSLSWACSIQSITPHPTSWRSILLLFSHLNLGLTSGLFHSGFPTKNLYTHLSSPIRATCPAHLILLDFITRTILGEVYRSFSSSLWILLHCIRSKRNSLEVCEMDGLFRIGAGGLISP